jgi:disulfide bond formation protein DsbB
MGVLCMIYGAFIVLMLLIPNSASGRLAIAFCALAMAGIGWGLYRASKKHAPS